MAQLRSTAETLAALLQDACARDLPRYELSATLVLLAVTAVEDNSTERAALADYLASWSKLLRAKRPSIEEEARARARAAAYRVRL
jgi:hypothetical protein